MTSFTPTTSYTASTKNTASDLETILAHQLKTAQSWMMETQRAYVLAGQCRQHYNNLEEENRLLIKQLNDAGLEPEAVKSGDSGPDVARYSSNAGQASQAWENARSTDSGGHNVVPPVKVSPPTSPPLNLAAIMPCSSSPDNLGGNFADSVTSHRMSQRISKQKVETQLLKDSMVDSKSINSFDDELEGHGGRESAKRSTIHGSSQPKAVFADANALKEKLRMNMSKPAYDVRNFYKDKGLCQNVARAGWFDNCTLTVIGFNAIWIAVDTDRNHADLLLDAHPVFITAENFFCTYFFLEWALRFGAFKNKLNCRKDAWFVFDSSLVFVMVGETWVMNLLVLLLGGGSSSAIGNASILRLFRLLRLSRMARMARLLRAMPELMVLIKGMVIAMRSVFFTLILLTGILYVFGIAFVQLMKDTEKGDLYFKTVPAAMNSLLLLGILPDEADFIEDVGSEHWVFKVVILIYTILAALCVMNMLVGVLCEVVSVVSSVEKESLLVNYVKSTLRHMLTHSGIDADGDHLIAKNEFEALLELPGAAKAIQEVGVDVIGLMDFTDFIFKDGKALSFPDFMEVVLQLRGSNTATVKDVVDLRKLLVSEIEKMSLVTSGAVDHAVESVSAQLMIAAKKAIHDALPQSPRGEQISYMPMPGLAIVGDKQGMSWASTAASRLNAAANELSAAAGQLSARRRQQDENQQDNVMLEDEEGLVPGSLRETERNKCD